MLQFLEAVRWTFSGLQTLRSLKVRLLASVHTLAVRVELWSRPSQEVTAFEAQDDFDEFFEYAFVIASFLCASVLITSFLSGAFLAWSCARARERPPGKDTTSADNLAQIPRLAPRDRTPLPLLQQSPGRLAEWGSARRRSRSNPLSPQTLDFDDLGPNIAHFPVPLCSPRAAPSARDAPRQPSADLEMSSSQGSRCRLRRIMYSP